MEFQNIYYDIMQPIYRKLNKNNKGYRYDDIREIENQIAVKLLRAQDVTLILSLDLNTSSFLLNTSLMKYLIEKMIHTLLLIFLNMNLKRG